MRDNPAKRASPFLLPTDTVLLRVSRRGAAALPAGSYGPGQAACSRLVAPCGPWVRKCLQTLLVTPSLASGTAYRLNCWFA